MTHDDTWYVVFAILLGLLVIVVVVLIILKCIQLRFNDDAQKEWKKPHVAIGYNDPERQFAEPKKVQPKLQNAPSFDSPERSISSFPIRKGSRYTFEREAKGKVKIIYCDQAGKYIAIQNTSRLQVVDVSKWQLVRTVDRSKEMVYIFPEKFEFRPLQLCKVYGRDSHSEAGPDDLVMQEPEWITGHVIETVMKQRDGLTVAVFSEFSESGAPPPVTPKKF